MARSERLPIRTLLLAPAALLASACSDLPSKDAALEVIKQSVQEDATCTLPIGLLSNLKMQHSSKAVCVAREGGGNAMACLDALVAAGMTKRMSSAYMAEWPDELSGAGFDSVSPYERRARNLLFQGCVEMAPGIREGQFRCGEAHAEKVVRITKQDDEHVVVRYSRAVKLDATLEAIDAACGAVTRPAPEGTATLEKVEKKTWILAPHASGAPPATSAAH